MQITEKGQKLFILSSSPSRKHDQIQEPVQSLIVDKLEASQVRVLLLSHDATLNLNHFIEI